MANDQVHDKNIVPRSSGFFQELVNRFRLVGRLMMDSRVNPFLKVLPIGTLIYVFSPIDLMPVNPLDDALILWAGTTLFVELCPPEVIDEHLKALSRIAKSKMQQAGFTASDSEVIEGDYYEVDSRK
jgi:hypothetical protein